MLRKTGLWIACGCMLWLVGCGITITLPGGTGPTCTEKDKCNPGSGGTATPGGTVAPSPGATSSPSDGGSATPSNPPTEPTNPTKPEPAPLTSCQDNEDCSAGERCVANPNGGRYCKQLGCSELRRDECLQVRGRCFLEWLGPDKYLCREPAHSCEKKNSKSCEEDPICHWQIGQCYCPEDADCECGGGPPSNCKPFPCEGIESCQAYCMSKFNCCAPYGSCDDLHIGCNLVQNAVQLCKEPLPCWRLGKRDCDIYTQRCTWNTTSGQGACVAK